MNIELDKSLVEIFIQKAARLTGKHLTLPVLSCIYLEAQKNNILKIKSTNLDIGVDIDVKVKTIKEGKVAVPANILVGVLSSIKDNNIKFEAEENNLKISSNKNSILIKCMQSDDFPSIPKIESSKSIKIKSNDLLLGFKSVWYSASLSTIKPELGSIFIYQGENGLVFVSTDSFRLAEKKVNTKINDEFPQVLIPYKNVVEIIKVFEDYKDDIEIIFDKNQASFVTPQIYLVSRLVDGSFPDYKQIIPKSFTSTVTLLKNDLVNSIKTSNIFSDTLNQVKIKIESKSKSLYIESKNNDVGEYKESIKASIEGDDLELNFNNKYITDCMQSIPGESLTLSFGGPGKPLSITGSGDKSFNYIVMPMNR